MSDDHFENRNSLQDESSGSLERTSASDYEDWPERRAGEDRRSGEDRRKTQEPIDFPDRRSGEDRREGDRRKTTRRIPIFIKLPILSTLLIFFVISTIFFDIIINIISFNIILDFFLFVWGNFIISIFTYPSIVIFFNCINM